MHRTDVTLHWSPSLDLKATGPPTSHQSTCDQTRMITLLVTMLMVHDSTAEIIKPYGEWLCNYCAMGE